MFNVGDRVRIRDWGDMEDEFGINYEGDIKAACFFTKDMKFLCGKNLIVSGSYPLVLHNGFGYEFKEGDIGYTITDDMLELVVPIEEISYEEFEKIINKR